MNIISCVIVMALLLASCGSEETATPDQAPPAVKSMAATEQLFTKAAEELVNQYSRALKAELMSSLNDYGPAQAINFCNQEAQGIAASHSAEGWQVKRVSRKWRNILDRPDTAEITILEMFDSPTIKDNYLFNWSGPDSARVFHYYKRIMVSELCLQCHGDLQTFDLDLYNRVKLKYPYDKATGYKVGDLRGMFSVSVDYPAGEDMAKLLAEGVSIVEFTKPDTTAVDTVAADTLASDTTGEDTTE